MLFLDFSIPEIRSNGSFSLDVRGGCDNLNFYLCGRKSLRRNSIPGRKK